MNHNDKDQLRSLEIREKEQKEMNTKIGTEITLHDAPRIEGLRFRGFSGDSDFAAIVTVIDASREVDGREFVETEEELKTQYQHLVNSDPATDMLFAEVNGEVIGYTRVWWQQVENGPRTYGHFAYLVPAWRGKGIRTAMLRFNEARLRAIAAGHQTDAPLSFEAWAAQGEHGWIRLLEQNGYEPVRYNFEMVRPDLEDIPDLSLPEGLVIRPVKPEAYQQVWDAAREAFRDHWGHSEDEWADAVFESWKASDTFKPELWQVAWDGDEVAGMVLNFISQAENETYHRKRGYTETICVRRPYRRRGLARALIARSLRLLKELGMTEAGLGVDAENPNGALQLYRSMGYETVKRFTLYRKPLDAERSTLRSDQNAYHP